ncbi:Pr6Pr family membrane protein [Histidinibacterium lentulum]|uniref:Pr6Pr family membrane protein n=1 Tax=Histidinibacterium lentulum TaxID=2480588 RepID=A0A3N2R5Q5_9RHOB|nr:Pr6Pr family membrane protein [Histidinibacterium lentulum]ROU02701.1 hypothetical protein EAT49_10300 [Histidinibacterium lentulum]
MHLSPPDRLLCALIALLALGAVGLRVGLTMQEDGDGILAAVWELVYFFTILTNLLIGAAFGAAALRGRALPAGLGLGLATSILIVGIVYHVLLADIVDFTGLGRLADLLLHTVVPLLTLVQWTVFAPKRDLSARQAAAWLAYPGAYVAYVFLRAPHTGWYPYPFLDLGEQGLGTTLLWIAGIAVFFLAMGLALVAMGRALQARRG